MKIAIASEHAGFELKEKMIEYLRQKAIVVDDLGARSSESIDYPYLAARLSEKVARGEYDQGILICGTGIGMALAAGKVPGARPALCTDPFMARMSREHNDANILCLGAWITGLRLSLAIVDAYLTSHFTGGRHARRLDQVRQIEEQYRVRAEPKEDS